MRGALERRSLLSVHDIPCVQLYPATSYSLFFFLRRRPPRSPLFPYTTLFRSPGERRHLRPPRRPHRARGPPRHRVHLCQRDAAEGLRRHQARGEGPVPSRAADASGPRPRGPGSRERRARRPERRTCRRTRAAVACETTQEAALSGTEEEDRFRGPAGHAGGACRRGAPLPRVQTEALRGRRTAIRRRLRGGRALARAAELPTLPHDDQHPLHRRHLGAATSFTPDVVPDAFFSLAMRALTSLVTSACGRGLSAANRTVPLPLVS